MLESATIVAIVNLGVTLITAVTAGGLTTWYDSHSITRERARLAELEFTRIRQILYPGAWLLHQAARGFLPDFVRRKGLPEYCASQDWRRTSSVYGNIWQMALESPLETHRLESAVRHALRYSLRSYQAHVLLLLNAGYNVQISSAEQESPFLSINRIARFFLQSSVAADTPEMSQTAQRKIGQNQIREIPKGDSACLEYWEYLELYEAPDSECRKAFDEIEPWIDSVLDDGEDRLRRLAQLTADLLDQLQGGNDAYVPTNYLQSLYDFDCLYNITVVSPQWFRRKANAAVRPASPPRASPPPPPATQTPAGPQQASPPPATSPRNSTASSLASPAATPNGSANALPPV